MTIAHALLLFLLAFAAIVVLVGAGFIYVWMMRIERHDPHAFAFADCAPFALADAALEGVHGDMPLQFPSAGVALRPDAGGRGYQPLGAAAARTRSAS